MSSEPAPDSYAAWRDRLAEANDPKFWPIEEIDRLLVAGEAQFWSDGTSGLVTRIVAYPGGAAALEAIAAAGELESLSDHMTVVAEIWAREIGLTHLKVVGRPGWARVHVDGWRHHQCVLLRELADG